VSKKSGGAAKALHQGVIDALTRLLRAADYAEDVHVDIWQFSIEWNLLRAVGLERADVRWLVARGYVELRREVSVPAAFRRTFLEPEAPCLCRDTAFILTASGLSLARSLGDRSRVSDSDQDSNAIRPVSQERQDRPSDPSWDRDRRELRYREKIVKAFRVPAPNQELILEAFQEEGWPEFINDPLPPAPDQDPHPRLQATIKSLNRRQSNNLIRFRGNGGERVFWQTWPA
jgi:hypothetical protein